MPGVRSTFQEPTNNSMRYSTSRLATSASNNSLQSLHSPFSNRRFDSYPNVEKFDPKKDLKKDPKKDPKNPNYDPKWDQEDQPQLSFQWLTAKQLSINIEMLEDICALDKTLSLHLFLASSTTYSSSYNDQKDKKDQKSNSLRVKQEGNISSG
jgi:hypothetical protein